MSAAHILPADSVLSGLVLARTLAVLVGLLLAAAIMIGIGISPSLTHLPTRPATDAGLEGG